MWGAVGSSGRRVGAVATAGVQWEVVEPIVSPLNVGDVLAGKFRVLGVLGSGGMAVVLAAEHLELGQKVAIKMLHPQFSADPTMAKRFVREGRNAVQIQSEHVCRVTDVARRDDGTPLLVMEHLEGKDLAKVCKENGPLPISDAVEYVLQACEAVAVAHSLGIIHRDLKPPNLFLTRRVDGSPCVKVLDFGISKALISDEALEGGLTLTTNMIGSPMYMSPEQMEASSKVDLRTDLWALGMILFKLLTGKGAYRASNIAELARAIANEAPLRVRALRPEVPEGLDAAVNLCLQRDRDQRCANVAVLAASLAPFAPPRTSPLVDRIQRIVDASPSQPTLSAASTGQVPAVQAETVDSTSGINASVSIDANRPLQSISPPPLAPTDAPPQKRSRRALFIAAGIGAATAVGMLIVIAGGGEKKPSAASGPPDPPALSTTAPSEAKPEKAATPSVSAPPSASSAAPLAASIVAPRPPAVAVTIAPPTPTTQAAPKATTKPSAKASDPWGW